MILSIYLYEDIDYNGDESIVDLFEINITNNLCAMADEAGIYDALWCPLDNGIEDAEELIAPLKSGLYELKSNPEKYKAFNPLNKSESYDELVESTSKYLNACIENPKAKIWISK